MYTNPSLYHWAPSFQDVFLPLHIQVPHFQRVVLNERPPRLDLVAHEDGEDGVGVDVVLDLHAEEAALGGIHRGLPELRRVHLAEALVALDRKAFLGAFVEAVDRLLQRVEDVDRLPLGEREVGRGDRVEGELVVRHGAIFGAGDQVPVDADLALDAVALRQEADIERAVVLVPADDHPVEAGGLDHLGDPLDLLGIGERQLVLDAVLERDLDRVRRIAARDELLEVLAEERDLLQEEGQPGAGQPAAVAIAVVPVAVRDVELPGVLDAIHQIDLVLAVVLEIGLALAVRNLVERRLRDVEIAALDDLRHLTVEEGQDQRPDVAAVYVGVAHDDQLVIAQLVDGEVVLADAGAERRDHGLDLVGGQHLVEARLLDVEDLPLERQDGLEAPVAALLGRAAGGIALDQEELGPLGVALGAVGELAGEVRGVERALAPGEVARLAGRLAGVGRLDALLDDPPGLARILLQMGVEPLEDHLLDPPLDVGGDQLVLGLRGELGVLDAHGDHRREPLAHVLAGEVLLQVLRQAARRRVGVDGAGERPLEAGGMGAAVAVVDRVGEGVDQLLVAVVPLQRDLDRLGAGAVVAHVDQVNRLRMERRLVAVQVLDEGGDAARVDEIGLFVRPLVLEVDVDSTIEERLLAQTRGERLVAEFGDGEDLGVRPEADLGAGAITVADRVDGPLGEAAVVGLEPGLPLAPDLQLQGLGEGVDHRDADAVEAAGDLVGVLVELTARVQLGHDDLGRRPSLFLVDVDRDAAAVVLHRHRVVGVDGDVDPRAVARLGLVDRVVDHLEDHTVQAGRVVGIADVHARALAHRFQALEDLDVVSRIGCLWIRQNRFSVLSLELRATPRKRGSGIVEIIARKKPSCESA